MNKLKPYLPYLIGALLLLLSMGLKAYIKREYKEQYTGDTPKTQQERMEILKEKLRNFEDANNTRAVTA